MTGTRKIQRAINDSRPINCITFNGDYQNGYFIGQGGVTAIKPYEENGHMAGITWLAVFQGEHIIARIPSEQVTIIYAAEPEF